MKEFTYTYPSQINAAPAPMIKTQATKMDPFKHLSGQQQHINKLLFSSFIKVHQTTKLTNYN